MKPPGVATGRALTERAPQEHAPTGRARSLSVIVPTHGRAALLPAVVEGWLALAPSLEPATAFELVVVDDGSPDATPEVLAGLAQRHPGRLTLVRQANGGLAAARNAGVDAAGGELLFFADDDMLPASPDLLARHLHAQARRPGAWVSHLRVPDACARTPFQAYWRRRLHAGTERLADGADLGYGGFWFACLSLPRRLLGERRFSQAFRGYGWEEHELGYRLHRAGVRARFLRGAHLEHHDPVTLAGTYAKHVAMGRAAWTFRRLHPSARVALWTGAHPASLAWRRLTRLEARAAALLERDEAELDDRGFALVLEGGYSRGLREGRLAHA